MLRLRSNDPEQPLVQIILKGLGYEIAPIILNQPAECIANPGETVRFSVEAVGAGDLTYQWASLSGNLRNGDRISGATSSSVSGVERAETVSVPSGFTPGSDYRVRAVSLWLEEHGGGTPVYGQSDKPFTVQ